MELKSRDVSLVAIFASIYVVLVYLFAPISFYALQFRVAGVIRPAIAKKWILAIGYAIGVVVANLFSPFVGIYELIFMPVMSLVAGLCGYIVATRLDHDYFVAGAVIATIIPFSVSWMLYQLFNFPILVTFPYTLVSEQILCFIGAVVFRAIELRFRWW